jgi:serine/threonine protein kinase
MSIGMIMEVGDVDLAKVLMRSMQQQQQALKANSIVPANSTANPFFLRSVWGEMLEAVDYIHENRIVHGDLKPANFVFVRGRLKLIDFGIAKAISNDTTNIYRDSQIGTVNYMAPEAIYPMFESTSHNHGDDESKRKLKMKLGRASDIWSLGCILYQMIYGKPPFAALNTIQKLHAIPNPKFEIQYPIRVNPLTGTFSSDAAAAGPDFLDVDPDGIASIKLCLHRDPIQRAPIKGTNGLLNHPFLDLRLARQEWSKQQAATTAAAAPAPPAPAPALSRSETLFAARDSIINSLNQINTTVLTSEETGACQEVRFLFLSYNHEVCEV